MGKWNIFVKSHDDGKTVNIVLEEETAKVWKESCDICQCMLKFLTLPFIVWLCVCMGSFAHTTSQTRGLRIYLAI